MTEPDALLAGDAERVALILACFRTGSVPMPLPAGLKWPELRLILRRARTPGRARYGRRDPHRSPRNLPGHLHDETATRAVLEAGCLVVGHDVAGSEVPWAFVIRARCVGCGAARFPE